MARWWVVNGSESWASGHDIVGRTIQRNSTNSLGATSTCRGVLNVPPYTPYIKAGPWAEARRSQASSKLFMWQIRDGLRKLAWITDGDALDNMRWLNAGKRLKTLPSVQPTHFVQRSTTQFVIRRFVRDSPNGGLIQSSTKMERARWLFGPLLPDETVVCPPPCWSTTTGMVASSWLYCRPDLPPSHSPARPDVVVCSTRWRLLVLAQPAIQDTEVKLIFQIR